MASLVTPSVDFALESARRRIARLEALPVLDPRLLRVLAEQDVNLQYQQLRELLRVDPALAARVLKVANSAFYGARSIASIDRALTVLGAVAVAGIAVVARFDGALALRGSPGEVLVRLRRHSLVTAVAAKALAERVADRVWNRESAFVLGLLHDLGWLVQLQLQNERSLQCAGAPAASSREPEEHAVLSAALFAHWQLPAQFIDAVRDHHGLPDPGRVSMGSALLAVAEQCAGYAGDEFGPRPAPADTQLCVARFGLTEAELAGLGTQCAAEAAAIDGLVH